MNENKSLVGDVIILAGLILIAGCMVFSSRASVMQGAGDGPITITVDGKPVSVNVDGKPTVVSSGDGATDEQFGANAGEVTYWISGDFSDDLNVQDRLTASKLNVGSTGSLLSGYFRATSTVNADAITAGSATSLNMTLTGVVAGDMVSVGVVAGDLGGSTSTVVLRGMATAADTVNVVFLNTANTSTQASFNAGPSVIWLQGTH